MKPKRTLKQILIIIVTLWALLLTALFIYISGTFPTIRRAPDVDMPKIVNHNLSVKAEETMEGYWTVALFGVDSRDGSLGKGNQSDLEMVCNIDWGTGEIRLASIYRDTYLQINENGECSKINQAYCDGGPAQAIRALNENLDLKCDDFAAFNWKAVVDAINLLGGIDLEVSRSEFKVINGFITETVNSTGVPSRHLKRAGMNHLDGVQAVAFARLRKMDTDFRRTERQREVVQLVMEKAKAADFAVLNNIMVTVLPQISTSVGLEDVIPLAQNLKKFHMGETAGFPFKMADATIDKKDCVVPSDLKDNVVLLHRFLFEEENYEPSQNVKDISQRIENSLMRKRKH